MKFIGGDDTLLEQLNKIYIISSSIKRFSFFTSNEDVLVVEIDFELLYDRGTVLRLRFTGIKEYSF